MQLHFSQFEEFSSILSGYDLNIHQIDRGSFSAVLQQIQSGAIFVNRFTTTRRLEVFGNPPPGVLTFGIPTEDCLPFFWRGKSSDGNSIQIYKKTTELEMYTHPFFEAIDISMSEEKFVWLTEQYGYPELIKTINRQEMIACGAAMLRPLRRILKNLCHSISQRPETLQSPIVQNIIQHEVPYFLIHTLVTDKMKEVKASKISRHLALKTVVNYLHETPNDKISLSEICTENDINVRTMQRAFQEHYGVTPKQYTQALRFNNVYKTLYKKDATKTQVSSIASQHGFWHMGQFAKDYKRHFGVLPSETLRC
jgi:AraC family ethanolamine operon transcriptional activator